MAFRPKNGNWVREMIERKVLVALTDGIPRVQGGSTLICDSETDPTALIRMVPGDPSVRHLAFEAGVLVLSPDTQMRLTLGMITSGVQVRKRLGISPIPPIIKMIVLDPLIRAWNEGIHSVLLCVNPHSIAGPMLRINPVDLVDHMLRAGAWLSQQIEGLNVGYIVHVPSDEGEHVNYYVSPIAFQTFYAQYETEVLGRQDDDDPLATVQASNGDAQHISAP